MVMPGAGTHSHMPTHCAGREGRALRPSLRLEHPAHALADLTTSLQPCYFAHTPARVRLAAHRPAQSHPRTPPDQPASRRPRDVVRANTWTPLAVAMSDSHTCHASQHRTLLTLAPTALRSALCTPCLAVRRVTCLRLGLCRPQTWPCVAAALTSPRPSLLQPRAHLCLATVKAKGHALGLGAP